MSNFEVRPIEHQTAKAFVEKWHYSQKLPSGFNFCFGAFLDGELYAVADYGMGSNMDKGAALARLTGLPVRYQTVDQDWRDTPHLNMNTKGLEIGPLNCLELKRLCRQGNRGTPGAEATQWKSDEAKIPLTRFLAICHRYLRHEGIVVKDKQGRGQKYPIKFIVSYSDPGELKTTRLKTKDKPGPYHSKNGLWHIVPPTPKPHSIEGGVKQENGHIYRAANFQFLGLTAPETHNVDEKGNIFHRRIAYKEMKRWNAKHPKQTKTLDTIRKEHDWDRIVTPPKGRWFIALEPRDTKELARRLLAGPVGE